MVVGRDPCGWSPVCQVYAQRFEIVDRDRRLEMGDLATGQDVSGFEIAPVADRQFRRESLQNRGTAVEVEDASVGKARRVGDSISLRRPVDEREGRGIGVRGVAVEEKRLARTVRPPSPFRK